LPRAPPNLGSSLTEQPHEGAVLYPNRPSLRHKWQQRALTYHHRRPLALEVHGQLAAAVPGQLRALAHEHDLRRDAEVLVQYRLYLDRTDPFPRTDKFLRFVTNVYQDLC